MTVNWRRFSCLVLVLLAGSADAAACSFRPQPLTTREALAKADSVFLGTITAIEPGLPADFKPQASSELAKRRDEGSWLSDLFEKKADPPGGQTLRFAVERQWKGVTGKTVTVLSGGDRRQSSCDANYNLQRGDRMLVFAHQDGNYAALPLSLPDPLSAYNRYDPTVRHGKVAPDHPYAKAIADEIAWFQQILQELPQQPASTP